MLSLTEETSDVSRTNQLRILSSVEEVAEKLFQYLYKMGKGIEVFSMRGLFTKEQTSQPDFYSKLRPKIIKREIQKRLAEYGEKPKRSDIQYFLSYSGRESKVFFVSPNKQHSGWKELFSRKWSNSDRERIFNLVFKLHLLAQELPAEMLTGFEELLFLHSKNLTKNRDALLVWGHQLLIRYNYHNVLTLTLSRKSYRFLPRDPYSTMDADDLGELLIYKKKSYHFDRDRDARRKNSIRFIQFPRDPKNYDRFKRTQLYYYQYLMTKLEFFLKICEIQFSPLHFQADHYLENAFVTDVGSAEPLEIINNIGIDLSEDDKQFLQNFLGHQGVGQVTFYNSGKTVSTYMPLEVGSEEDTCWQIEEVAPWSDIQLEIGKNYLVFNRLLDETAGSMAYQREDVLWRPSTKIEDKSQVDFYSQLKRRFCYQASGKFFSTQGINIDTFRTVSNRPSAWSLATYTKRKVAKGTLYDDTLSFTDGRYLDTETAISCYLSEERDPEQWEVFWKKYGIKVSPEFQKVLIELGIKNWIRESLVNSSVGLSIGSKSFCDKEFYAIYVRSPRNRDTKASAVKFVYSKGRIHIKDVICDTKKIRKRFRFLRKRRNSDVLTNDQQYLVDEAEGIYISCYTNNYYTPTLIGRDGILEELEAGELLINRSTRGPNSSRLLPLVSYYNGEITPRYRIENMICFDLKNDTFIQYYIPPGKSITQRIERGFRVYHLIGFNLSNGQPVPTSELIQQPITALHFGTLTYNVLRISDNSRSSLLQKVARVLVEN
jgi:hypothetical protein